MYVWSVLFLKAQIPLLDVRKQSVRFHHMMAAAEVVCSRPRRLQHPRQSGDRAQPAVSK